MSLKKLFKENLTPTQKRDIKKYIESGEVDSYLQELVISMFEKYHKSLWDRRGSWRGGLK